MDASTIFQRPEDIVRMILGDLLHIEIHTGASYTAWDANNVPNGLFISHVSDNNPQTQHLPADNDGILLSFTYNSSYGFQFYQASNYNPLWVRTLWVTWKGWRQVVGGG